MTHKFAEMLIYAGYSMQVVAFIALVGLVQASDPNCLLETDVLLQLRLCGPEYVVQPEDLSLVALAIIIAVFVLGKLCVWWGREKNFSA